MAIIAKEKKDRLKTEISNPDILRITVRIYQNHIIKTLVSEGGYFKTSAGCLNQNIPSNSFFLFFFRSYFFQITN